MFALILALASWSVAGAIYSLYQVSEGEHEHEQRPLEHAIRAVIDVGLAVFLFWVAFSWC